MPWERPKKCQKDKKKKKKKKKEREREREHDLQAFGEIWVVGWRGVIDHTAP